MFVAAQDFNAPSLTMSDIKQWASEACQSYLAAGVAPTDTLCKMAQAKSLTPHQMEVLAGEINKTIHIAKYASVEDKYHAAGFPLADAKVAIASLQSGPQEEKVAFAMPDPIGCDLGFDYDKAFGVAPENFEKKASSTEIRAVEQKLASLKSRQDDAIFMAKHAAQSAEYEFIKEARQMVLEGYDRQERMKKLANVVHAVRCAGLFEQAQKPLAKLAFVLGAENIVDKDFADRSVAYLTEKKADITAPQELVSEFLNARVVNGNHPLLIKLKTYADAHQREKDESYRCGVIDDKSKIFKQTFRAL